MTISGCKITPVAAGAATAIAANAQAAELGDLEDFIGRIRSQDDAVRGPAWQGAASRGAPAVKLLIPVMEDSDFETARAARRALWNIVRHAGRPRALKEGLAVSRELVASLPGSAKATRRELLWMLSEVGTDEAIPAMAALLTDADVRSDAQCALMRLPGRKATAALRSAFGHAPEDFKYALADSLRKRGDSVKGYPSQKLLPSRPTTVTQPKPA
jgi:hypothetical protein